MYAVLNLLNQTESQSREGSAGRTFRNMQMTTQDGLIVKSSSRRQKSNRYASCKGIWAKIFEREGTDRIHCYTVNVRERLIYILELCAIHCGFSNTRKSENMQRDHVATPCREPRFKQDTRRSECVDWSGMNSERSRLLKQIHDVRGELIL